MFYEFCPAESYLFQIGERGNKYYIILEGKVGVFSNVMNEKTGEFELDQVLVMGPGGSFGELALEENRPRAASIYCIEDSHFAVLEKTDYKRILSQLVKGKRMAIVDFL